MIFDPLAWYLSKKELHCLLEDNTVTSVIRATEEYVGRGYYQSLHAVQSFPEIQGLTDKVQQLRPKVVVEIGTYKGGTLFIWCRALRTLDQIVSIDLPGAQGGGGYDYRRSKLYREFVCDRPHVQLHLMRKDSHSSETLARLKELLGCNKIDFLFIDGDHTYDGVKSDFEMYAPLVRSGGLIAFHDIVTTTSGVAVDKLWTKLKARYRTEEFVALGSNKGIGVLYVAEE